MANAQLKQTHNQDRRNFIGGSTASAKFEGEIFSIISEPAAAVIKRVSRVEK